MDGGADGERTRSRWWDSKKIRGPLLCRVNLSHPPRGVGFRTFEQNRERSCLLSLYPVLSRLIFLDVVSMNPGTGLGTVASFKQDILFVLARHQVYARVDIFCRAFRFFRLGEKYPHIVC